jgi:hypothetical protein
VHVGQPVVASCAVLSPHVCVHEIAGQLVGVPLHSHDTRQPLPSTLYPTAPHGVAHGIGLQLCCFDPPHATSTTTATRAAIRAMPATCCNARARASRA